VATRVDQLSFKAQITAARRIYKKQIMKAQFNLRIETLQHVRICCLSLTLQNTHHQRPPKSERRTEHLSNTSVDIRLSNSRQLSMHSGGQFTRLSRPDSHNAHTQIKSFISASLYDTIHLVRIHTSEESVNSRAKMKG
jgi:hypothetical protein